jgi:arylsulfatase A-like enzyme
MLKNAGYATGCFGKWHLGDQPEFLPTSQGFDKYYGIPYSNDMWTGLKRWQFPHLPVMRGTKVIDEVKDMDGQAELCRLFTEEAVKFIEKNKDRPFFAYIPHAFVHGPRKARPEFMAKAKTVEEAQVEECDWSAGQILDAVRKAGIEKNTFVLFTSDNGGARGLSSGPLRGGKGSMWEGGFRGPAVAWWPGTIPAGSTCSEMASTMDLMPTFAKWAGGKVPDDRVIDGKEVSDLFLGEEGAKTPHDRFFFNARNTLRAVRSGPWKLFLNGPLHNLDENLGETKNYASKRPGVVKRLKGYMAEFERDLKKNSRPVGVAKNPKTLVPRPGAKGEDAYTPTLWIGKKK